MKKIYSSSNFVIQFIFATLCLLSIGVGQVWGLTEGDWFAISNSPYVYFDNSKTQWSSVSLFLGRQWNYDSDGVGSYGQDMTAITNTQLWVKQSQNEAHMTTLAFFGVSGWNWEGNKVSDRAVHTGSKYTNSYNEGLNGGYHLYTPASGSADASLTKSTLSGGYTDLNKKQTVKVMISTDGGSTYAEASQYYGTITANRYTMASASTTGNSNKTLSFGDSYASAVITSSITFTASATNTGYTFMGWGESSSATPDGNESKTYTVDGAKTIYAFYVADAIETLYTITLTDATVGEVQAGSETHPTITAVEKSGFMFSRWETTGGASVADATSATTTVSATAAGTVTATYVEDLTTDWQLNLSHDGWHLYDFVKKTGESTGNVAYYTMELPNASTSYEFEIRKKSTNSYYKNTGTMTSGNCTNWEFTTGASSKAWITATIAGPYIFKVDFSGANPVVSVTYPRFDCAFGIPAVVNNIQSTTFTFTPNVVNFEHNGYEFYYTNDGGANWNSCAGVSESAGVYSYTKTFATAGTYRFKVVVKNGAEQVGEPLQSREFSVVEPTINLGVPAYPRAGAPVTVTPTVTGLQSGEYHYCWSIVDQSIDFTDNYNGTWTFTAPAEGNYTLRLEVKPGSDCAAAAIISKDQPMTVLGDFIVINMVRDPETLWKLENNIYYYKDATANAPWPGVQMTFLGKDEDDYPWYTYTIEGYSAYDGGTLIFNDAQAAGEGCMHQTSNIPMPQTDGCYYVKANLDHEWKRQYDSIAECPDLTRRVLLLSGTENKYQNVTYTIKAKAVFFTGNEINYTYSARIKDGAEVDLDDQHSFIPANAATDVTYVVSIRATSEVPGEDVTNSYEIVMHKNPVTLAVQSGSVALNNSITLRARRATNFPANSVFTFTVIEPGTRSQVRFSEVTKTESGSDKTSGAYTLKSTGTYTFNVVIRNEGGQVIGAAEYSATIAPMKAWVKHNWDGSNWTWKEMTYRNDGTYAYYAEGADGSYFRSTTANDTLCSSKPTDSDQNGATTTLNPDNVAAGTIVVYVYDVAAGTLTVRPASSELRVYRIKSVCSDGTYYSNTINASGQEVSFYAQKNGSLIWQSRLSTAISAEWVDGTSITTAVPEDNVYTATASTLNMTNLPLTKYTGKYTIYSMAVKNGAQQMTSFTPNPDAANEYFNNYYVLHKENGNAMATVGNAINHNLSIVLPYYELPIQTNLRFAYNNKTNVFARNYLANATGNPTFLQLYGLTTGNLKKADGTTTINEGNPATLIDQSNWVYTYDAKGVLGADDNVMATIRATYNGMQSWILSSSGLESDNDAEIELLTSKISKADTYTLRLVYDYKTNRLTSGWIPSGTLNDGGTTESVTQARDILIQRTNDAETSQFSIAAGTVVGVDKMTTEFIITKAMWTSWDGNTVDGKKTMFFWISLPYDCKLQDVYGFGKGNVDWDIQRYRGDLRDKGTAGSTAWRDLHISSKMNANEGYVLAIRLKASDFKEITIDGDTKSEIRLFFPSSGKVTLHTEEGVTMSGYNLNHSAIQQDWHVMGVPVMKSGRKMVETGQSVAPFEFVYRWTWANGDRWYEPIKIKEGDNYFNFLTGHAYMVQGHGALTWNYEAAGSGSVLNAPQRTNALTSKDIRINLMQNDEVQDKTYVLYRSNGSRDYEIGRDLEKIENANRSMIYSELDNKLAAICLADTDMVQIPLTIVAAETGEYILQLSTPVQGVEPVLYDAQENTTTLLNHNEYVVDLNKGTYRNRFFLGINPAPATPTAVGNTESAEQVLKYVDHMGNLYILRRGKTYDAQGRMVK